MKCEKCGAEVVDGTAFCPNCGTRVIPTVQVGSCGKCGAPIDENAKFCAKCGAPTVIQDLKCRKCGADTPAGTKFCPGCGAPTVHGDVPSTGTYASASSAQSDLPGDATYQYFIQGITKKYADFKGRARRREFWFYVLFNAIAGVVCILFPPLLIVLQLALLVPGIAIVTRRLHDIGKSGWWQLLFHIPLVGFVFMIIWMTKEGDSGTNQYGPNPKA